jgi:hypothetical protein
MVREGRQPHREDVPVLTISEPLISHLVVLNYSGLERGWTA